MPKYDADTVARWRGSIAKWEGIVAGTHEDGGANDCPLCQRFNLWLSEDPRVGCDGCPIYEHTQQTGCGGTPYDEFEEAGYGAEGLAAAKRMLDFLRGLDVEEE